MSVKMTRRALIAAGAVAGGYLVATRGEEHEAKAGDPLVARRVGSLPLDDPRAGAWGGEGETVLPLTAQQLATPKLAEATVPEVRVAALHDGTTLGLRLSWLQQAPSELSGVAKFQDAAAVMLPGTGPTAAPITMGAPKQPVHIVQWRASWQKDVELGVSQGVEAQFPNVIRDIDAAELLPEEVAVLWNPARALRNPMAAARRTTPVEELIAEGFGSTTRLPRQTASGTGVHHDRHWWVTIGIPLTRTSGFAPLAAGQTWPLAVAIWDGAAANRGGRKHFSAESAPMLLEA